MFSVHGKNCLRWPQMGPGGFFPTNPDLADILGRTDFDFENFFFWISLGPKFLAVAQLGPTHLGPAWAQVGGCSTVHALLQKCFCTCSLVLVAWNISDIGKLDLTRHN